MLPVSGDLPHALNQRPDTRLHASKSYAELVNAALERDSLAPSSRTATAVIPVDSRTQDALGTDDPKARAKANAKFGTRTVRLAPSTGYGIGNGDDITSERSSALPEEALLVPAGKLSRAEKSFIVQTMMDTQDQDTERFLRKVRARMDRVGIDHSKVEVRYSNLNVEADVYVGSRAMPTVFNAYRNVIEGALQWMHVLPQHKHRINILNCVSGVLRPGRMTLLLGPPSSGKSTLLRALSGKLKQQGGLQVSGSVTYNGKGLDQFVVERTAAYVEQVDNHIGELTVRETMDFAARCQGPGHKEAELTELCEREAAAGISPDWEIDAFMKAEAVVGKRETIVTEYILRLLGLEVCADTVVGNAMLRGVSGGQRKRVTTGEMIVGPTKTLFLDEISTGLDSSTTYQIVKCMRDFVQLRDGTVLMALLQPPPEVYDLFDDVILLSEGTVVYHGPCSEVLPFFEGVGFRCPERKGVPDFLQEVTSKKDQGQYWCREDQVHSFVTVPQFASAFQASDTGRQLQKQVDAEGPLDAAAGGSGGGKDPLVYEQYALSGMQMFKACMRRDWVLMKRNFFVYIFRCFQVVLMAIITGTTFIKVRSYPIDQQSASLYMGCLFFSLLILFFDGSTEMVLTVERIPVFTKQRDLKFFTGWAYTLPTTILRLPYSAIQAVLWSCILYWTAGLAPDAGRFFMFMFILFSAHQLGLSLFRAMGALARDPIACTTAGFFVFLVMLMLGGFIVRKADIQPWWIWAYWISPFNYAQRALTINEFTAQRWQVPDEANPGKTLSETMLGFLEMPDSYGWVWRGLAIMWGFTVLLLAVDSLAHMFRSDNKGMQNFVSEDELAEKAAVEAERRGDVQLAVIAAPASASAAFTAPAAASTDTLAVATNASKGPATVAGPSLCSADTLAPMGSEGSSSGDDALETVAATPATTGVEKSAATAAGMAVNGRKESKGATGVAVGVGKESKGKVAGGAEQARGMVLPFQALTLTFRDLHYFVTVKPRAGEENSTSRRASTDVASRRPSTNVAPRRPSTDSAGNSVKGGSSKGLGGGGGGARRHELELLCGINGAFRPGVLTALMGVSGAGKTTLLDVLAGRKTGGRITGEVLLDGFPKDQATFARISGYVEQTDVHSPAATVREAVQFSAHLRFPRDVALATVDKFVDEVMGLVELTPLRNALVGVPGQSGLSVEQRKRLTIAVELVANPSIIFMDEPTSGLDARAAAIVMRAVRNIVNTGRTLVCTIHQPSIDIFESFDELLLLKRGGQTIYNGPLGSNSSDLINYFGSFPGISEPCNGINPATWMLEISTPGSEERLGIDFAEAYASSDLAKEMVQVIEQNSQPKSGAQPLRFDSKYAQPALRQFIIILHRNLRSYWRTPSYNAVRFFSTITIGLLFGTIFWGLGQTPSSIMDIQNISGALYCAALFLGAINAMSVQPMVDTARTVYYRENAAGMYSALPYAIAANSVETPYIIVQCVMYSVITYFMAGFQRTAAKFFWYLLFTFLTLMTMTSFGIATVAVVPVLPLAGILFTLMFGFWNLFSGFIVPLPAIPGWYVWIYYLNPIAWTLYGLVGSQLTDLTDVWVEDIDGGMITVSKYMSDTFGYENNMIGWVVVIMFGFLLCFRFSSIWALSRLNFQKR